MPPSCQSAVGRRASVAAGVGSSRRSTRSRGRRAPAPATRRSRRAGAPGVKTAAHPGRLQHRDVLVGDDPAARRRARRSRPSARSPSSTRGTRVRWAPDSSDRPTASASSCSAACDDLLGRLVQAGVDDLEAGVAQRPGDHLGASVVAVEAWLGDDDAVAAIHSPAILGSTGPAETNRSHGGPQDGTPAAARRRSTTVQARRRPRRRRGISRGSRRQSATGRGAVACVDDGADRVQEAAGGISENPRTPR